VLCPVCGQRKARRACPALNQQICAICCGTKRLVEIRCPSDCVYLTTARTHPPAVVQKQQEHDIHALAPSLAGLNERQTQLFFLIGSAILRHRVTESLQRTEDQDVAGATASLAATYETAGRGVIYEHQPDGLPAQRIVQALRTSLAELIERGGRPIERDLAIVMRRLEKSARETAKATAGGDTAFLDVLSRMLVRFQGSADAKDEQRVVQSTDLVQP
jgi:hypothetical protein